MFYDYAIEINDKKINNTPVNMIRFSFLSSRDVAYPPVPIHPSGDFIFGLIKQKIKTNLSLFAITLNLIGCFECRPQKSSRLTPRATAQYSETCGSGVTENATKRIRGELTTFHLYVLPG